MPSEWCPVCHRDDGTHATVFHVWMPRAEQERRLRWFTSEEAEAWLRRRLAELLQSESAPGEALENLDDDRQ